MLRVRRAPAHQLMQTKDWLPVPEQLLAGVSGGADSVALLYLLRKQGTDVTAVHVNHGLRGDASDGDEAFVRSLCESWQVPLLVYRLNPPENAAGAVRLLQAGCAHHGDPGDCPGASSG